MGLTCENPEELKDRIVKEKAWFVYSLHGKYLRIEGGP